MVLGSRMPRWWIIPDDAGCSRHRRLGHAEAGQSNCKAPSHRHRHSWEAEGTATSCTTKQQCSTQTGFFWVKSCTLVSLCIDGHRVLECWRSPQVWESIDSMGTFCELEGSFAGGSGTEIDVNLLGCPCRGSVILQACIAGHPGERAGPRPLLCPCPVPRLGRSRQAVGADVRVRAACDRRSSPSETADPALQCHDDKEPRRNAGCCPERRLLLPGKLIILNSTIWCSHSECHIDNILEPTLSARH